MECLDVGGVVVCREPMEELHRRPDGVPEPEFYEEDEPVQDVVAAFDRGEKGVTRRTGGVSTAARCGGSCSW